MPTASLALERLLPGAGDRSPTVLRRFSAPVHADPSDLTRRRAVWLVNLVATAVIAAALTVTLVPAIGGVVHGFAVPEQAGWMTALAMTGAVALAAGRYTWRLHGQVAALRRDLAAARETERWHRAVVEEVVDGVMVASPEGRLVEVNQAACLLLGRTREQITGQRLWDLIPADDRLIALRRHQPLGTHGGGLRRLLRPDGSALLADVSWSALPDGRVVYLAREWAGRR
ncbi:MAG TPA: PAS domain-containing protein [Longimicrobium sp.]|nr:PAS domain-containing protein [Longimicrobium sp.]